MRHRVIRIWGEGIMRELRDCVRVDRVRARSAEVAGVKISAVRCAVRRWWRDELILVVGAPWLVCSLVV